MMHFRFSSKVENNRPPRRDRDHAKFRKFERLRRSPSYKSDITKVPSSLFSSDEMDPTSDDQSGLLDRASQHYNKGLYFRWNHKLDEALEELKKSLVLRESLLGRYNKDTSNAYGYIANAYFKKSDYSNALASYMARLRIRKYLRDEINDLNVDTYPNMKESLLKNGLTEEQILLYNTNIKASIQYEKDGDSFRQGRDFTNAIGKYKEAIAVEKECIGNDITIAFLWRKVAVVAAIDAISSDENNIEGFNWNKIDCINDDDDDFAAHYKGLSGPCIQVIQLGDTYHKEFQHKKALIQYQKAFYELNSMQSVILKNQQTIVEQVDSKLNQITQMKTTLTEAMESHQRTIMESCEKIDNIHRDTIEHVDKKMETLHHNTLEQVDRKMEEIQEQQERMKRSYNNLDDNESTNEKIHIQTEVVQREMIEEVVTSKLQEYTSSTMTHKADDVKNQENSMMMEQILEQVNDQMVQINHLKQSMDDMMEYQHDVIERIRTMDEYHRHAIERLDDRLSKLHEQQSDYFEQQQQQHAIQTRLLPTENAQLLQLCLLVQQQQEEHSQQLNEMKNSQGGYGGIVFQSCINIFTLLMMFGMGVIFTVFFFMDTNVSSSINNNYTYNGSTILSWSDVWYPYRHVISIIISIGFMSSSSFSKVLTRHNHNDFYSFVTNTTRRRRSKTFHMEDDNNDNILIQSATTTTTT